MNNNLRNTPPHSDNNSFGKSRNEVCEDYRICDLSSPERLQRFRKSGNKCCFGIDKSYNKPRIIEFANCITSRENRGISNRKAEGTAILENTNVMKQIYQIYGFGKEKNPQAGRIYDKDYIAPTLDSMSGGNRMPKTSLDNIRIRKLTPRECFNLMGLNKEYADKASEMGISNSSLYKAAGNGIVTNCVQLIAEHLYKAQYDNSFVCTDERILSC